jgi:comEA protein
MSMRPFTVLREKFGFTRNEILALLILSATLLAGISIRWYTSSRAHETGSHFNYAVSDSIFSQRSESIASRRSAAVDSGSQKTKQKTLKHSSININTAGKEQLMKLPGIGEVYAERIIRYREDHGPFTSVEELIKIKGIGVKTMERIRPYIKVQ